jgi:hypothetical protein
MEAMTQAAEYHPGGITGALADPGARWGLSAWARRRRWAEFSRRFPDLSEMRVLDLGGTASYWQSAPVRPGSLVLLNLFEQAPPWDEGARVVIGSACAPPAELAKERFDLVVSNSVIGQVGGHARREEFAETVHQLGSHHWIQTPYRYFPIDPVFLFPGFTVLPFRAQVAVSRLWPLGHRQAGDPSTARDYVLSIEFLTQAELRHYFPDSDIWRERLAGLTKSLVAVR